MKFRPLHDRVVVKRIDAEEKSSGGIIIPDTAKEKPSQGEIIAVGPGGRDESGKLVPLDVQVGNRVLFGKWSGTEVKIDGVEYLIMKESDIMGRKRPPDALRQSTFLPISLNGRRPDASIGHAGLARKASPDAFRRRGRTSFRSNETWLPRK